MVTSTGSGLSVPDWPTTYGQNMFTFPPAKWVGGIFFEHGHRLVASAVGFLTIGLGVWLAIRESRRCMRILGWLALGTVICQGILGGLTVRYLLPTPISVFHACLAQSFFCIVLSIALFTSPSWRRRRSSRPRLDEWNLRRWSVALICVVFAQLLLGALMRHTDSGLAVPDFPLAYGRILPDFGSDAVAEYNQMRAFDFDPPLPAVTVAQIAYHLAHRLGAAAVTIVLISTSIIVIRRYRDVPALRRPAVLVLFLLALQIGLGAFTVWSTKAPWIATAHVAVGAAMLGTCWLLVLQAFACLHAHSRASVAPAAALSGVVA